MDDVDYINDQLKNYPRDIYNATLKTEDLRESWQLEDARRDYELAKEFLTAKAAGLTVGEADRKAIESVYLTTQIIVKSESMYRRALADQTRLENEFTGIRKQAELLKLTEHHMAKAEIPWSASE